MIDREMAQKAIDEAFADGVKRLYAVLENALVGSRPNEADALERFKSGLASHCDAYARASAIIDAHFGAKS